MKQYKNLKNDMRRIFCFFKKKRINILFADSQKKQLHLENAVANEEYCFAVIITLVVMGINPVINLGLSQGCD